MTVLKRVSQKEMKRRTGFGTALGYSLPEKDEILIRKDLPKKVEKEVISHEEEHISKGEEGPFLGALIGIGAKILGSKAGGALIGAGASLLGAKKQAKAAKQGVKAQTQSAADEIAFAKESRDLARRDEAPYREAGYTALDALMSMTGLKVPSTREVAPGDTAGVLLGPSRGIEAGDYLSGLKQRRYRPLGRVFGGAMLPAQRYNINEAGPENVYSGGSINRTSLPQTIAPGREGYVRPNENPGGVEGGFNFMTDPGYEFRLNEGQRTLERGAAAAGGLLSGGFGRRAIRYGQDYASNEYQNVYNRIANIAGLGQVSSGRAAQGAYLTSQQVGGALGNAGYARASGYTARGNAWTGALNDLSQVPWGEIFKRRGGGESGGGYTPGPYG